MRGRQLKRELFSDDAWVIDRREKAVARRKRQRNRRRRAARKGTIGYYGRPNFKRAKRTNNNRRTQGRSSRRVTKPRRHGKKAER